MTSAAIVRKCGIVDSGAMPRHKKGGQDGLHLKNAQGWMELGSAADALGELQGISAGAASSIDALRTRYTALASTAQWNCALLVSEVAVTMFPSAPEAWVWRAHAIRASSDSAAQARDALARAGDLFPDDPIVLLNLALYECELQHSEKAADWLLKTRRAATAAHTLRAVGQLVESDPRLRDLWRKAEEKSGSE